MSGESQILKLKKLQSKLGDLQTNRARLEGKKEQLLENLKTNFQVSDIAGAKKRLAEFEKELDDCEAKVNVVVEKMEKVLETAE